MISEANLRRRMVEADCTEDEIEDAVDRLVDQQEEAGYDRWLDSQVDNERARLV